jgi:hypothetical protein
MHQITGMRAAADGGVQRAHAHVARCAQVVGLTWKQVFAERGYDHDNYRRLVWAKNIKPRIARRSTKHGSGLGVMRRVIERTIAWYHGMRRLRIRYERRDDIHEAFLGLAT